MDILLNVLKTVNACLSDYILVILLTGCGVFLTAKTRFVQVRCFGDGVKSLAGDLLHRGKKHEKGISPFQALSASLAAQVGTGNIIGVCAALLAGGPGAIFWMWIFAFLGMATIYTEAVVAQKTRIIRADGTIAGGPVYYINRAFKGKAGKILAGIFGTAALISFGSIGPMMQSNAISSAVNGAFGIPKWIVGIICALLCGIIFIGGVKRIASVSEKLVPVMVILYVCAALAVIVIRIRYIPESFAMIFRYAFVPDAIIGGSVGFAIKTALSQGAKRGLFSNEAGMGSTPHAHALANVSNPHDQGVLAMMGLFIDTFVVVNLTALVVISTLYAGDGILSGGAAEGIDSTVMAKAAFSSVFGDTAGGAFTAVCLFLFAFTTIMAWNFFARINSDYFFGRKSEIVVAAAAVVFVFIGSVLDSDLLLELSDLFNQIMVIPNAPALIVLSGSAAASAGVGVKVYGQAKKKAHKKPKEQ